MSTTRHGRARAFGALALGLVALGACATARPGMSADEARHHAEAMALLDAADRGEIEEARLALSRAADPEVRRYAQMMIDEHSAALQNRQGSMQAMGMTPAGAMAAPAARALEADHRQAMQRLSPLSGAAFDRAYMQRQAAVHASLLQSLGAMAPAMHDHGAAAGSGAPAGGITPASGGYAVPLSCDPGNSPAGPGSGRTESGVGTATNTAPRGNCGTPPEHPPLHGAHAEKGTAAAMNMDAMHRNAVQMVSMHLRMAQEIAGRM